jgi:NitT/TauT family transport system permease protein
MNDAYNYHNYPAWQRGLLRAAPLLCLAALWEALPRLGFADPMFLPPLSVVVAEIALFIAENQLLSHALVTLWRVLNGVTVASILAIPLGALLAYRFPAAERAFNPLFRVLGQVNPFSLMIVFLLFFGIGERAKLAMVSWAAFWPILHYTVSGVKAADPDLIKATRSMGVSGWQLFWLALLPEAARHILLGVRTAAVLLLSILIAGEMLGGLAGLGWLLHWAGSYYVYPYATAPVFAVGLCISLVGVGLGLTLRSMEQKIFFWRPRQSLWTGKTDSRDKVKQPSAAFYVAIIAVLLGIMLLGSLQADRLVHLNNSFADEWDEVPPETLEPAPGHHH